jgi:hypothetical protein
MTGHVLYVGPPCLTVPIMAESWRPIVSQDQLAALSRALRAYALGGAASGRWEPIDEAPWFRHSGPGEHPGTLAQADLSGLDLRGLDLPCANLRLVRCVDQDLSDAVLDGSLLRDGLLAGTRLCGASLRGVDLSGADLSRCDLSSADLSGAVLTNTILTDARLRWEDVGRGRWRVERKDGPPRGELGEIEQDHQWTVIDQKNGRWVGPFDGTSYVAVGSDPVRSGTVDVSLSDDGYEIVVTDADGTRRCHPLPDVTRE